MTAIRGRVRRHFWDAHSAGWDKMRSEPDVHAQIVSVIDAFTRRLHPGGTVADLGCGTGQHAIELAARGFEVIAVDYSPGMLARAREHARDASVRIDFRAADLNEDLPFGSDALDGALCVSSLQLVDEPTHLLTQLHHAVRAGGVVLIESVRHLGALSRGAQLRGRDKVLNSAKKLLANVPGLVKIFNADDIAKLCEAAQLEIVSTDFYDDTFAVTAFRQ